MKRYQLILTKSAVKRFKKLPRVFQEKARKVFERLQHEPRLGIRLAGDLSGFYKIRLHSYRVIYRIEEEKLLILIIAMGHRKEVYRRARKP